MDATEFNTKYALIVSAYGRLRVEQSQSRKWAMQTKNRLEESCRLFLYLRTLMRYVPGVNLTDCDIDIIFSKALKIIAQLRLPLENVLSLVKSDPMDNCSCGGSIVINETINNLISNKPSPESIFYNDTRWNIDHTAFTEPAWAGFQFKVMSNTDNRFLTVSQDGFDVTPEGGFTITGAMYDGQEFIPIF